MKAYLTYDRYEHDEWYSVYHIDTDEQSAIEHFIEKDLISFLGYGPDDCHTFVLQEVEMSVAKYKKLCELIEDSAKEEELRDWLMEIYDSDENVLYSTDGCSDNDEILALYCQENNIDRNNYEEYSDAYTEFFNNDKLWEEYARKYIAKNY